MFSPNLLVLNLKDKKAKTVLHGFIEIVTESKRKPNKVCVDQRIEFYNDPVQEWLDKNGLIMMVHSNQIKVS